ncbi:MAG TPA: CGNR zinc finger domain-containing protein, partial [Thermoanaerobaculia bacterium]
DLVYWGRQVGLLDEESAARLSREAARHPRKASEALAGAIRAREALRSALDGVLDRREAAPETVRELNRWIADALAHRRLIPGGNGCLQLGWEDDGDLLAFLRPVAADAADVLAGGALEGGLIRRCELDSCEWVFIDETRNRSRRWCSMKDCGNRAKARRHYERVKAKRVS